MRRTYFSTFFILANAAAVGIVGGIAEPVFAQAGGGTADPSSPIGALTSATARSVPVTLNLKTASLSDVIRILGAEFKIPILADSFLGDPAVADLTMAAVPAEKALQIIAEKFDRTLEWIGPVAVLRHKRWYSQHRSDNDYRRQLRENVPPPGSVTVRAVDPEGETKPMGLPPRRPRFALPPKHVSVIADRAAVGETLTEFSSVSQQITTTTPPFTERRVTAHLSNVTPNEFLAAMSYLLDLIQQVNLTEGEAQKERATLLAEEAADTRPEDRKVSDELKDKLLKLLSPDQRAAAGGKETPFPVQSLPPALKDLALKYIGLRVKYLSDSLPGMNASQFGGFSVVLLPPPSIGVGIDGVLPDGTHVGF
ncbi:MAG: hypothetical protein V4671_02175 [Armatimonadota bacterium]